MKKYAAPELELIKLEKDDIITTSSGTVTTPEDENDGIWDLNAG